MSSLFSELKDTTKEKIADTFARAGWRILKSEFDNYKLTNEWSYLVLDIDENRFLLHGDIDFSEKAAGIISKVFEEITVFYRLEIYQDDVCIYETKSKGWY